MIPVDTKGTLAVLIITATLAFTLGVSESWGVEKIFFSSSRANPGLNRFHIWMMNPDGTGLEQLTFGNVIDSRVELSPDGTKLVVQRSIPPNTGATDVWVLDLISRAETQVTSTSDSFHPTWCPDVTKIAFNRGTAPGTSRIWIVDYLPSIWSSLPGQSDLRALASVGVLFSRWDEYSLWS